MVLITGGFGSNGILNTGELYDPLSGKFTLTGAMASARYLHTATLLSSGKVLIAVAAGNSGDVAAAELYDPAAGTFFTTNASMIVARDSHICSFL
jgi:hypothetical protein